MKKILTISLFVFIYFAFTGQVLAYYGVPYGYPYGMMYPYGGCRYSTSAYYHSYELGRHPVRDARRIKYMKEYYSAIDNGGQGNNYQNGDKVVNVNVSM